MGKFRITDFLFEGLKGLRVHVHGLVADTDHLSQLVLYVDPMRKVFPRQRVINRTAMESVSVHPIPCIEDMPAGGRIRLSSRRRGVNEEAVRPSGAGYGGEPVVADHELRRQLIHYRQMV